MSDIAQRVKKIVVEHLGVHSDMVTDNASFRDELEAGSLDTIELVMAFEEEFGCEFQTMRRRRSRQSAMPSNSLRRERHYRSRNSTTETPLTPSPQGETNMPSTINLYQIESGFA